MGIRIKLLLVWIALLLAPLAILSGIGYVYIDNQLQKGLNEYRLDMTRSLTEGVGSYLTQLAALAGQAAAHPDLIAVLSEQTAHADQLDRAAGGLRRIVDHYVFAQQFYLVKERNFTKPILSVPGGSTILSSTELDRLSNVAGGEPTLTFLTTSAGSPCHTVVVHPVPTAGGRASDFLVFVSDPGTLIQIVNDVAIGGDKDIQFFLADNEGQVLGNDTGLPFNRLANPDALLPRGNETSRSLEDYQLGRRNFNLNVDRIRDNLWLVAAVDTQKLFEKKLPYITVFIMTLSLTLLLSGLIYNIFINNLAVKPIHKLIGATRQIAKGDFRPPLNIRSKDELGELAIAFRQMGKQLMHTSRRIRQLAYFDPLTQLPNRTTLRETLNRLLSRSHCGRFKTAVLFIDLDDFKKVNDRLGHEAGDELLVQISDRLKDRLRQSDMLFEQSGLTSVEQLISRRGGDEFNAILSSIKSPHDAAVVAERIIQDLNEPFFIGGSEIHVGASVGIAIFPDDGRDADTLLRNADLAMYEAKAKGKNNYHIFTPAINAQVHQRLALENALQVAMVQSQFRLYYQPKIRLADMRPVGFEALIRWQHPERGIILPNKFIPVAEESNLIRDIGTWILGESMQQVQVWDKYLPEGVRVAINISARQLAQNDLVDQLRTMMEHFALSPKRLEIELTETSVLQDEHIASQHLSDLRALGVEVSLDDFGTGYSSLSFLRKLPIDTVKIDRSFTANVLHNSEARAIVISLLGLCRELKVKTIAEGIETTEQLQFLMEYGCDQGQGFLFSAPLPSNEVMRFLETPNVNRPALS